MPVSISRSSRMLLLVFAAFSVGLLIWATRWDLGSIMLLPMFGAWLLAPYAVLWFVSRRLRYGAQAVIHLIGSLAVGLFGVGILIYGFVANPDPQSGLLLLFIPIWQLVGAGLTVGLGLVAGRIRKAG